MYSSRNPTFADFSITLKKNKKGEWKKKPEGFPDDWLNTTTKIKILKGCEKNQTILTGKINNLTVLDFDLMSSYN